MNEDSQPEKTWDTTLYDGKNAFVWKYGQGLVELLTPQSGERILDLGCGTGQLTNQIAVAGAVVLGIDKSRAMIEEARKLYPNLSFEIADGTDFHFDQPFDAVFSNAAIHWMRDQPAVTRCIWEALRPGGRFVAEFGGSGNIRAIRTAPSDAIQAAGEEMNAEPFARYYPAIGEYATLLEAQGFRVTFATHFDRPTKLDEGEKGLRNWLFTFADNIIESLCRRLLGRLVSEYGRLCHGDGGPERGERRRRGLTLPTLNRIVAERPGEDWDECWHYAHPASTRSGSWVCFDRHIVHYVA